MAVILKGGPWAPKGAFSSCRGAFSILTDAGISLSFCFKAVAELQADDVAVNLWKEKSHCMWMDQDLRRKYPITCGAAEALIIPFPTTYMVESSFSVVNDLLTKKRNRLEISKRGDLRLRRTSLLPTFQNWSPLTSTNHLTEDEAHHRS